MNIEWELVEIFTSESHHRKVKIVDFLQVKKILIPWIFLKFVEIRWNSDFGKKNKYSHLKNENWYNFCWNQKWNGYKKQPVARRILQMSNFSLLAQFLLENIQMNGIQNHPVLDITTWNRMKRINYRTEIFRNEFKNCICNAG